MCVCVCVCACVCVRVRVCDSLRKRSGCPDFGLGSFFITTHFNAHSRFTLFYSKAWLRRARSVNRTIEPKACTTCVIVRSGLAYSPSSQSRVRAGLPKDVYITPEIGDKPHQPSHFSFPKREFRNPLENNSCLVCTVLKLILVMPATNASSECSFVHCEE